MGERKTVVPSIPAPGASVAELLRSAEAQKEAVEVAFGRRGDQLDRFVTVRELRDAGIAQADGGGSGIRAGNFPFGGGPQVPVDVPGSTNGLPDNTPPNYGQEDYTPPPMPTNVAARSIPPNRIMVTFDPPAYGNHAYAEVFGIPDSQGRTLQQMLDRSPGFNPSKPCTGAAPVGRPNDNPCPWFRGRFEGSNPIVTLTSAENPGATDLGAALNPPVMRFFVRFVSLAKVSGPFGPQGDGAPAQPSIDPLLVLNLMTANVTASAVYSHLRNFIGTDANALATITADGKGVTSIYNGMVQNTTSLGQLWSVKQERLLDDGSIVAAGFGLGITVDQPTGRASSLFAVNADQFAIMGTGTPFAKVTGYNVSPGDQTFATVTVSAAAAQSFRVGQTITFRNKGSTHILDDVEGDITLISGTAVTVVKTVPAYTAPGQPTVSQFWPFASVGNSLYMTGVTNIPFIVDTANSVVGIRGKLVVDGLVRATSGEFNSLSANTAFIASIRANLVNANILVGQSIIAGDGLPDGATVNDIDQLDSWIVRISRVTPGGFPLRIYNPKRYALNPSGANEILAFSAGNPLSVNEELRFPYLYLNGNFRLGGNATINLREGGAVGLGAKSSDGVHYTMWTGADTDWNTTRAQMDANGAFWIRPRLLSEPGPLPYRAGFNLDLFLGENSLAVPFMSVGNNPGSSYSQSGNTIRANGRYDSALSASSIQVRGLRSGGVATTLVTVTGNLVSTNDGTTNNGDDKSFILRASLVGQSGSYLIQEIITDDWSPEAFNFALSGPVQAPAGTYQVLLEMTRLDDRYMAIIQGWNVVAFQVATNGALT